MAPPLEYPPEGATGAGAGAYPLERATGAGAGAPYPPEGAAGAGAGAPYPPELTELGYPLEPSAAEIGE